MKTDMQIMELLNDLIQINRERIAEYEKAARETAGINADLSCLFETMAEESRTYINDLLNIWIEEGAKAEIPDGLAIGGKVYRSWMSWKNSSGKKGNRAILTSCKYGEGAIQKVYEEVLSGNAALPAWLRKLLADQKSHLKLSHDKINREQLWYATYNKIGRA